MLSQGKWHDWLTLSLESEQVRITIVPELGGKVASLVDKRLTTEWLIQPRADLPVGQYKTPVYTEANPSGWDEMFPTIDACVYPIAGRLSGRELPDHGELWSRGWTIDETSDKYIALSLDSNIFPCRFRRSVALENDAALLLKYALINDGDEDVFYLWAAHALFEATPDTRIELPAHVTTLYNALEMEPWGVAGTIYEFPAAQTGDGRQWMLDRVIADGAPGFRKFYVQPDTHIGSARIRRDASGAQVTMTWDDKQIPYFGLWLDEGVFTSKPTIGLEPSSAFYDRLTHAHAQGRLSVVKAQHTVEWWVRVQLADIG